jgi:ABC-type Fe3+-hydroxamate transport system substrate-binding protein
MQICGSNKKGWRAAVLRAALLTFTVILCALMACALSSCKYSDVLTEHIEIEGSETIDESIEPTYVETEGAPPDPTRTSTRESDSDRVDEQTNDMPEYGQGDSDELANQREQDDKSADDTDASDGTETSEREGQGANAGGEATSGQGEGAGQGSDENNTQDEKEEDGEDGTGDTPSGGTGGTGQVFDATGENIELPDEVNSIAAAGQYATVVQMLAGKGGLACADAAWISDVCARGIFPDEGVDALASAWSTSGSTYTANIDAIIASGADAVLADGTAVSFTDEETAALTEAGISVVTVPTLGRSDTADSSILTAVSVVGELLKSAPTQYDTSAMADAYTQQHTAAIEACVKANGGYSYKTTFGTAYNFIYQGTSSSGTATNQLSSTRINTAFIDSWTTAINTTSTAIRHYSGESLYGDGNTLDSSEGAGLSASNSGQTFVLLDYYFQTAGVVNSAYEAARPNSAAAALGMSYLVVAGDTRELVTSSTSAAARAKPSALWFSPASSTGAGSWTCVGDADFPGIVVKTDGIAQLVLSSANKTNGLYNVGQSYSVRVMPTGVAGSWADGTVESFLAAPWTFCAFQQSGNFDTAQTYVDDFYTTFYRASSSGQISNFDTTYTANCPR